LQPNFFIRNWAKVGAWLIDRKFIPTDKPHWTHKLFPITAQSVVRHDWSLIQSDLSNVATDDSISLTKDWDFLFAAIEHHTVALYKAELTCPHTAVYAKVTLNFSDSPTTLVFVLSHHQ